MESSLPFPPSSLEATTLHGLIARQMARTPAALAVEAAEGRWTYQDLDTAADAVARSLRAAGVGKGDLVGLQLERSLGMVAAIVGTLRCGAAYLPLDPQQPVARRERILAEAQPAAVLLEVPLEAVGGTVEEEPTVASEDLAYVLYTSGSTGRPKGVMIPHGAIVNHMRWMLRAYPLEAGDRVLQKTPFGFDASVWEFFAPLMAGACLCLAPPGMHQDPPALAQWMAARGVTIAQFVPTQLRQLLAAPAFRTVRSLRRVFCGGEVLPGELVRAFRSLGLGATLHNLYGPTEAAIDALAWDLDEADDAQIPIGRPIDGITAVVVDAALRPVEPGTVGELLLGGRGLARGYLGQPELTAARFPELAFEGGPPVRYYRTGDRVSCDPAGVFWFHGRVDDQVKIGGARVELAEIEAVLHRCPGVAQVGVAFDPTNGLELTAVFLPHEGTTLDWDAVWAEAARQLPVYMMPRRWAVAATLPTLVSGKLDRRMLVQHLLRGTIPTLKRTLTSAPEAPLGSFEGALRTIFAEALGLREELVGRTDSFLRLGGDSLRAGRVLGRIQRRWGRGIGMARFFGEPTVAACARWLETAPERTVGEAGLALPPPRPAGRSFPLTEAQRRVWFDEQAHPDSRWYTLVLAWRLEGDLDLARARSALQAVVASQESLRTVFREEAGEPRQIVCREGWDPLPLHVLEVGQGAAEATLETLARQEVERGFELREGPLWRISLLRVETELHYALLAVHHLIFDGASNTLFWRDFWRAYRGEALPAAAERWQVVDLALEAAAGGQVPPATPSPGGWQPLNWVPDFPRPRQPSSRGGRHFFAIEKEDREALRALAEARGVTEFTVLLSSWQWFLHRLCDQSDLTLGVPLAGRDDERAGTVGFFVRTLGMPVTLSAKTTFAGLMATNQRTLATLLDAAPAAAARYEGTFVFQSSVETVEAPDGLRLAPVRLDPGTAGYDHSLVLEPAARGGLEGFLEYRTELLEADTARRWVERWRELLRAGLADPAAPLAQPPLGAPGERAEVVTRFNDTRQDFPAETRLHDFLWETAARTPDATAVADEDGTFTYGALAAICARGAVALQAGGVGPETVVAVMIPRSRWLAVGLYSVLRAGGAYLPIDPDQPPERIRWLLEDSGARGLILGSGVACPEGFEGALFWLAGWIAETPPAAPLVDAVKPSHLAYVLYTSGSTGKPKGVMIEHRAAVNQVRWMARVFPVGADDVFLQKAKCSYDVSVSELFMPAVVGATVVLPPPGTEADPREILRLVQRFGVTVLHFVPSMLSRFLADLRARGGVDALASLRWVGSGGEALSGTLAREFYARIGDPLGVSLHNLYGPTEATVQVASLDCAAYRERQAMPLGRPVDNTALHVLDAAGRPLPVGVVGELHIGGVQVGRGYIGNPALTARSFVPDPFSEEPEARLYRTGDRARWRRDGTLEYLGRNDFQVKIRGVRIELAEIERALIKAPEVAEAVVVTFPGPHGEAQLAAYVRGESGGPEPDPAALQARLRASLPPVMVPAAVMLLASFPVNASGKLDRAALPRPTVLEAVDPAATPPRWEDPFEAVVAAAWSTVLGGGVEDREADFFALGGDSLLAVSLLTRVCGELGVDVLLAAFLRRPTIAALTALARENLAGGERWALPPRAEGQRIGPLTAAQRRMWIQHQLDAEGLGHHIVIGWRLSGDLDTDALRRAVGRVVARHESLRTVFREIAGELCQVVLPPSEGIVESAAATTEQAALAEARAMAFDLEHGPLFRARLVPTGTGQWVLVLALHHLVGDAAATARVLAEIGELYGAEEGGEPPPGPQMLEVAAWERSEAARARVASQGAAWRAALAGAPTDLPLPFDRPLPETAGFAGHRVRGVFAGAGAESFRALLRSTGTTPAMGFLAAWGVFLGHLCDRRDLLIGVPLSMRTRPELEELVGLLLHPLPFRVRWEAGETFEELLARVRREQAGVFARADYPLEAIVRDRGISRATARSPVFQVMCVVTGPPLRPPTLPGVEGTLVDYAAAAAKVDLALHLVPGAEGWQLELEYRTDVLTEATVAGWLAEFTQLLGELAREPAKPLPAASTVLDEIAAVVVAKPTAPALRQGAVRLDYATLWRQAGAIARALVAEGVGRGDRVVWYGRKEPAAIVSILGILRAGAAYVPLDADFPRERSRRTCTDADPALILTTRDGAEVPSRWEGRARVQAVEDWLAADPAAAVQANPPQTGDLAYLIYTSGSTGKPKGVMITHGNLRASNAARRAYYGADPGRFLVLSSLAFDSSVAGLFHSLTGGGTLVLPEPEAARDPGLLGEAIRAAAVSTLLAIPSFYRELLEAWEADPPPSLERVIVAGEACPPSLVARHFACAAAVRLFNEYGPTEGTVWTSVDEVRPEAPGVGTIPIGRIVPSLRGDILDPAGQRVADGAPGGLWISGPSLSPGYWRDAALTAAAFRELPGIGRAYRTGDRVRRREDGRLEFLGREDRQVKVHGYRVEAGEVEAVLQAHPEVAEAVVLLEPVVTSIEEADAILAEARFRLGETGLARLLDTFEAEAEPSGPSLPPPSGASRERQIRREAFEILLRERRADFVQTPRRAQRDWMIGQAMAELADDLERLDAIADSLVPGRLLSLEEALPDVSQATMSADEIMEDWQVPLMRAMARQVAATGGEILEIGFGRGVSATFIQELGVRRHSIVEMNDHSVEVYFKPWRARYADREIELFHGRWQDVEPALGTYDGIFFHAFPMNEAEFVDYVLNSVTFAEHAFPAMAAHLRPGGVFTYLTTEIDSLSRRHQRALFRHFRSITLEVQPVDVPADTQDAWWASSMVVIKAVK